MSARDPIFDDALRAADIEAVAGVKLYGGGASRRGECPLCGRGKGMKGAGAFSVKVREKIWFCFGCEEGGDVIDLEHALHSKPGETLRDAAVRLTGEGYTPAQGFRADATRERRSAERAEAREKAFKAQRASDIWREAVPAAGTPVETYLRGRGLFGPWLAAMLAQLRFHPDVYHSGPRGDERRAPGMIGLLMTPAGPTGGVHITYLAHGGRGKADLDPAKKMLGPQDRDGMPGGLWLTPPDGEGPLIVAEGIESCGSAGALVGIWPCRMAAALSLRNLQGGWLADKYGRRDVDAPRADPEHPAFTWPAPTGGWSDLMIAVDRDMAPFPVKVRRSRGGTVKRRMTPDERAKVCGSLAEQAWRRAGAHGVRTIAPGPGRDFNDELRALLASGEVCQ